MSASSAVAAQDRGPGVWARLPVSLRAIIVGLSIALPAAILISSLFFTVRHLTKGWALIGMVPVVFGAGVLLGLLARASGSLIPCMLGHVLMDVGLFAYWWDRNRGNISRAADRRHRP